MARHDRMLAGERRAGWVVSDGDEEGATRALVLIRVWPARFGWLLSEKYGPIGARRRFRDQQAAYAAFEEARKTAMAWQKEAGAAWWAERV